MLVRATVAAMPPRFTAACRSHLTVSSAARLLGTHMHDAVARRSRVAVGGGALVVDVDGHADGAQWEAGWQRGAVAGALQRLPGLQQAGSAWLRPLRDADRLVLQVAVVNVCAGPPAPGAT